MQSQICVGWQDCPARKLLISRGNISVDSEFTPNGNTVTHEEFRSALVMLVLDCSSSLGTDFQSVKSAANQFIETLNGNTHQGN